MSVPLGKTRTSGTGYGESLRYELVPPDDYGLLEDRMAIFHSGHHRQSSEVNLSWMNSF
jgi:D-glycero-alpha-D-manno-heptose-7-phosphate kinase